MATGDVTIFEEAMQEIGAKVHNLSSDTIKAGFISNAATEPTAAQATPRWADFSANEVDSTAGNYTANGETLTTVTWTEADGTVTFKADSFTIAQHASGFTDGYWIIIYNDTAANDEALCYIELGGPVSEVAGDVVIKFNNVASGSPGEIFHTTD